MFDSIKDWHHDSNFEKCKNEELTKCAMANDERISKIKECTKGQTIVTIQGLRPIVVNFGQGEAEAESYKE